MIKICIADDHAIVREGLKQIIGETSNMVMAGEVANGKLLLDQAQNSDWDVVLLDIDMPAGDGLNTLAELKRQRSELPVLMLSIYPEEQYATRALKAGASGYLTKQRAPEELIAAIQIVSQGGKFIGASFA